MPEHVAPSLETQAILLETLIALDAALECLERPVREAFLWSQLDGLSHGEIAERLTFRSPRSSATSSRPEPCASCSTTAWTCREPR